MQNSMNMNEELILDFYWKTLIYFQADDVFIWTVTLLSKCTNAVILLMDVQLQLIIPIESLIVSEKPRFAWILIMALFFYH